MQIQNSIQSYSYDKAPQTADFFASTSTEKATLKSDTVTISRQAQNVDQIWQEAASKYDVNNISRSERGELTNNLVANGLITNDIALHMVQPLSMNEVGNDRANFLGSMKESLEFTRELGGSSELLKTQLKTIEMLERLKALI